MDNSPFNRSSRTVRTPPPSTSPAVPSPRPQTAVKADDDEVTAIATPELHSWMSSIEKCLNDVFSIASEGKLNSDQKSRIGKLCLTISQGTSNLVVQYQSLKTRALLAQAKIHTLQENLEVSQQIQDLKESIEARPKPSTEPSFADMVKKGSHDYIKPSNISSVGIFPVDLLTTSEQTKSLVQKIINPDQMKLRVRGLRKTERGGVIISTETKDDILKLQQSDKLKCSGLKIEEHYKRKPRIVVIGVPNTMSENEVFHCMYHQNLADNMENLNLESFLSSIKLSHKSGKKNSETCNYVIEVTAVIRKALITKDRLFVNWSSCPVRDFTVVTRCYKCQQYGHAAKTCRETMYSCGHCGDQGHTIKECLKKTAQPKCATCLRYKKPCNHSTGAADCPAKLAAEKRFINSIDYGGD